MEFSRPGHWSGWREVVTGPESLREDEETVAMARCMDARQDSARVAQETQWETEPVGQGAAWHPWMLSGTEVRVHFPPVVPHPLELSS